MRSLLMSVYKSRCAALTLFWATGGETILKNLAGHPRICLIALGIPLSFPITVRQVLYGRYWCRKFGNMSQWKNGGRPCARLLFQHVIYIWIPWGSTTLFSGFGWCVCVPAPRKMNLWFCRTIGGGRRGVPSHLWLCFVSRDRFRTAGFCLGARQAIHYSGYGSISDWGMLISTGLLVGYIGLLQDYCWGPYRRTIFMVHRLLRDYQLGTKVSVGIFMNLINRLHMMTWYEFWIPK